MGFIYLVLVGRQAALAPQPCHSGMALCLPLLDNGHLNGCGLAIFIEGNASFPEDDFDPTQDAGHGVLAAFIAGKGVGIHLGPFGEIDEGPG